MDIVTPMTLRVSLLSGQLVLLLICAMSYYPIAILIVLSYLIPAVVELRRICNLEKLRDQHVKCARRALGVLLFSSIFICGSLLIAVNRMPEEILKNFDENIMLWIENAGYANSSLDYYTKWKSEGAIKAGILLFLAINVSWMILATTLSFFGVSLSRELSDNRNKYVYRTQVDQKQFVGAIGLFIALLVITLISVEVPWVLYMGPWFESKVIDNAATFSFVWIVFTFAFFATGMIFCFLIVRLMDRNRYRKGV